MTPVALCSFCGEQEATERVVGEAGLRLCAECVARGGRIVEDETGRQPDGS